MSNYAGPLAEPQISRRSRAVSYTWSLGRSASVEDGDNRIGILHVTFNVYHDSGRKRFWTTAYPETMFLDGSRQMSISLMAARTWGMAESVGRFSVKALDAFAARALAGFREAYLAGDESITSLFAGEPS